MMITVEHTADYPFPAQRVFDTVADLAGHPVWQPEVLAVSPVDDDPVAVGKRILQTRKVMGRRTEIALTVTEFEPASHLVLATDAGAEPGVTQTYTITDRDGGSRCDFRLELDGVPRLAEHLARAQLSRRVPELFRRLATVLAEA
ncbi:SRPBCC family protein [Phytomonospora sp. NPDC050363]|uniref:SRPBCC family protein n=1 Tax=Phytomonospora sp. NPDC050363 TaxID=3155642 RepID=UPI0033EA4E8B